MLAIGGQKSYKWIKHVGVLGASGAILIGGYAAAIYFAPSLPGMSNQISATALAATAPSDNRLIIPTLGVDIGFSYDKTSGLNTGALWNKPNTGNPADGGNMILSAQKFEPRQTPKATVEKSPFYNLDKLSDGDKIIVDYEKTRYGYEVEKSSADSIPTDVLGADKSQLTLFGCDTSGKATGNYVIARPIGEVSVSE